MDASAAPPDAPRDAGDVDAAGEPRPPSAKKRPICRPSMAATGQPTIDAQLKAAAALDGAGQESEIPNFKGSFLGRFPLVSADFWTSDHLSERSRSVDAFSGTRARGTLTLKRR